MKSYIRQSIEAEDQRQVVDARQAIVDKAVKAFRFKPEWDEPEAEFHARIPPIVRGMARFNRTASRLANELGPA